MNRRNFLLRVIPSVLATPSALRALADGQLPATDAGGLQELIETTRKRHDLPGMAAVVMKGGRIVAEGVTGVREVGKDDKLTLDDRFGIGSCTKDMVDVMICRLVDAVKLTFETTLGDVLTGMPMREEYRKVTVAQLMTHKGGIQPYTRIGPAVTPILFEPGLSPDERRKKFFAHLLSEAPVAAPGGGSHYSNAGYALLGSIAAQNTGRDWQEVMRDEVFKPLGLEHSGFGRPRSKEHPNQPWLHIKRGGKYVPEPEVERTAEQVLGPAGNVHCSVRDLAKLASFDMALARGTQTLLKPGTAKRRLELSGGPPDSPAVKAGGAPWLNAVYGYWPKQDLAVAVAVNGGSAGEACESVVKALRDRYAATAK